MIRRRNTRVAVAVGIALLTGVSVDMGTSANAGQAVSANGYYTIYGHQYVAYAVINTGYISGQAHSAYAVTVNQWNGGGTTAGWAGARGRLFTSGGSLSCESSNTYNSTTGQPANPSSCVRYTAGAWYSYGVALGWNGSGYTSLYTYQSPNQNS